MKCKGFGRKLSWCNQDTAKNHEDPQSFRDSNRVSVEYKSRTLLLYYTAQHVHFNIVFIINERS
jgi:hypothetical protein